jgi:uroporphyrin-III C-methyltransferase
MITSKLTLVGAGPGDKDLITLKGIKAIQKAKVIFYDALANTELLDYAQKDSLKIYVGKRGGQASFDQEKINQLIVSYAMIYGEVVRLKGGDPFIFGRGYEEIAFAEKNGIETEVVPGISSSTGLTAVNKISLTQRGVADGFWVLTASKIGNEFNDDIALAAQSNSTVVILMGVKKLKQIVTVYSGFGKNDLPVMIIQNGSLPNQKIVRGEIKNITYLADVNQIEAPAIIVIGEVLKYKEQQELVKQSINYLN